MIRDEREQIEKEAKTFPAIFGLRAYSGKQFRIEPGASYVSDAGVILYVFIREDGDTWSAFVKGTPAELRREVVVRKWEAINEGGALVIDGEPGIGDTVYADRFGARRPCRVEKVGRKLVTLSYVTKAAYEYAAKFATTPRRYEFKCLFRPSAK